MSIQKKETGDRRQETGDRRQETGDRRQETGDKISLLYKFRLNVTIRQLCFEKFLFTRDKVLHKPAQNFQDLLIWQKAHQFVLGVYRFTNTFPDFEIYSLTSQFRRAAISVPANIAEGFKKNSLADKIRFMNIAQGSLEECRYYLILANDLNYNDSDQLLLELDEVSKMLDAYSNSIRRKQNRKQ